MKGGDVRIRSYPLKGVVWKFEIAFNEKVQGLKFAVRWNDGESKEAIWIGNTIMWLFDPKIEGRFRIIATTAPETDPADVPRLLKELPLGGEFGADDHRRISCKPHREPAIEALGGLWYWKGFWYVGIHPDYLGPLAEGGRRSIAAGVEWEYKW